MATEPESSANPKDSAEEVVELRAALDDARMKLDNTEHKKVRRERVRRILSVFLVVVTSFVFTVAVSAAWTRRTLFNTDQWVKTITPVLDHPSVTEALSERITSELMVVIDANQLASDALPPRAQLLSGPIVGAVQDFVRDQVHTVLASDRFQEFWVNANRFAHTQAMSVLRGGGNVLSTDNGKVTLNLLPVIDQVLIRIESQGGNLLGKDIDLPEITSGEIPEEARAKLSEALGVELPPDLGEIVVFESDKLEAAQNGLKLIDKIVVVLLVLALLLITITLWTSKQRRRTLIQLCAGVLTGMVLVRRLVIYEQEQTVSIAKTENRDAVRAIVDDLMRNFFRLTTFLIAAALITIAIAVITGPYPWAVKMRTRTRALGTGLFHSVGAKAQDDATTAWVRGHRDVLQIGGVVFLVLMLLLFSFSWIGFFVISGLVILFEVAVQRIGHDRQPPTPGPGGGAVAVGQHK